MNNDLISREALKAEVEWFKHTGYDENNKPMFEYVELPTLLKIIDRAPAVEEVSEIEFKEPLPMVKAQKIVKALSKGPKGEWTYHTDGYIAFYTCSKCNGFGDIQDKFCKHCGADMRTGGAE